MLTSVLLLLALPLPAQRATDAAHPEGRWEVLARCRLITNAVVDGDSFRALHKGREYNFRLYFVDAPETDARLKDRVQDQATYFGISVHQVPRTGELAARFTREKLSGGDFTVLTRWQNAMGRSQLARFYCEALVNGHDLAEELVTHGFARIHGLRATRLDGPRASTVIARLKNLELTAREEQRGVWDTNQFPRGSTALSATPTNALPSDRMITPDRPLDLNTATFDELQKLPGIGPKLAERIIAHRPYGKIADLEKVSGIGKKTVEKLAPFVRTGPPQ